MYNIYSDKIKEYEEKIESLSKTIKSQNQKLLALEKDNKNLLYEIGKLKVENKSLIKALHSIGINDQNIINQLGRDKDNSSLKSSLLINSKTGAIIANEKTDSIDHTKFYDVIICINSIKDINKGWEVKMSQKAKNEYEPFKKDKVLKIGVIGNSNKGKSFILSKISKIDLPSGTSIRTEGLSIKYPDLKVNENRKIALLDSAGLETPVLIEEKIDKEKNKNEENLKKERKEEKELKKEENEEEEIIENTEKSKEDIEGNYEKNLFQEKSREKVITELFLQNYIIHNSDILLVVVGPLTFSEQKLLNRIKAEIKRAKIDKPLYIIHNLKTYTSVEQVEEYIKRFLLRSATFELEKQEKISTEVKETTGATYYEKNEGKNIIHLIYANESSDAGQYYNNYTLNYIEKLYQSIINLKSFDVIKTVKERFKEISKAIIETNKEKIEFENDSKNEQKNIANTIKLIKPKIIKLKKCLIDELGFSNLKPNGYDPSYNYYKKDDKVIVRVEVPGNAKINSDIDYIGEYAIIKINGIKKKDKEPAKLEDNLFNSRELGDYYLEIYLKNDEFLLKNEKPKISNKNGVFILEYQLDKNENKNEYEISSENEI